MGKGGDVETDGRRFIMKPTLGVLALVPGGAIRSVFVVPTASWVHRMVGTDNAY